MIIGSPQRFENLSHMPNIIINGHQIDRVYKKEVLGITIDDKLNWSNKMKNNIKRSQVILTY
jgi:hypothetical protein